MKKQIEEPGGPMTVSPSEIKYDIKIREVIEYCKQKGISTDEITDEELEQFIIKK